MNLGSTPSDVWGHWEWKIQLAEQAVGLLFPVQFVHVYCQRFCVKMLYGISRGMITGNPRNIGELRFGILHGVHPLKIGAAADYDGRVDQTDLFDD